MFDHSMAQLKTRGAWTGIAPAGRCGRSDCGTGVRLGPVEHAALMTLIVRRGREADFDRIVRDRLSCAAPPIGRAVFGSDATVIGTAPGQWLAVSKRDDELRGLASSVEGIAAWTDQSSSRALLRISGASAREALQKGFAIDLHPSVFGAGSAATTKVAAIVVQIWQLDLTPAYMLAIPRSFAGSFWSWLTSACAAYGYDVVEGGSL